MGLSDLRAYLRTRHAVSLATLSQHFGCDAVLLRQMLAHWQRKGAVRCFLRTSQCGGSCRQCPQASVEMYEWVEAVGVS